MKSVSLMIALAALGVAERAAQAFCVPGTVENCVLNGVHGTRTCGSNGMFGPCVVPPPPAPPSGKVKPKYKVLTVIYAPPGKQGGGSNSSVSYESGSTWGSTSSATHAFKQEYNTSVTATAGFLGSSTAGFSFGYGRNSVDTRATDIKKSASTTVAVGGPAVDGIDHNRDQIWLWLNPVLNVSFPTNNLVEWKLDSSVVMDIQFVYVGHLKDPSQMPVGVAQRLAAAGITAEDYPEILEADPYANGPVPIDAERYKSLNSTFPYEPPFAPGDPSPTLSFTSSYVSTDTSTNTVTNEYNTGLSWEGGLNFITLLQAKLKVTTKWTWTDTKTNTTATGTSESARVTIGGPSFGYTGPTDMAVYYDTLYKSFLFVPIEGDLPTLQGWVLSKSNRDVAGKEVVLVADGVTYRTITDEDGEFRFFRGPRGRNGQLTVDRAQATVAPTADTVDIELP